MSHSSDKLECVTYLCFTYRFLGTPMSKKFALYKHSFRPRHFDNFQNITIDGGNYHMLMLGPPFLQKKVVYGLCGGVIFAAVVSSVFLLVFHDHKRRILTFGIICDVFNIIMYSSPLTIMVRAHPSPLHGL